jgi:hypothetical protein
MVGTAHVYQIYIPLCWATLDDPALPASRTMPSKHSLSCREQRGSILPM